MSRNKKFLTAASTFSVALGIGFVMQYGDAVASRLQPDAGVASAAIAPTEMVVPQEASITSGFVIQRPSSVIDIPVPVQLAAFDAAPVLDDTPIAVQPACDVQMFAQTLPMAVVAVSVVAPCQPNAAVTIHHQGMMFTQVTDQTGEVSMLVPALAQDALFISEFVDGAGAIASADVPELASVDRAVLQWQGVNAVQLHAREFGADYDTAGHVWSAAARELDFVNPRNDGFLITLGDPALDTPLMAEIYTFPSGSTSLDGQIALSVEAEVTADNCGREISAQSMQLDPTAATEAVDLVMTMPECDAIGEFLVLKNMFKDLTLAAK